MYTEKSSHKGDISRYATGKHCTTSMYPTRAQGIIVNYFVQETFEKVSERLENCHNVTKFNPVPEQRSLTCAIQNRESHEKGIISHATRQ